MSDYCEQCKDKGQKVPADVICSECRRFYCSTCRDIHLTFRTTKFHNMVKLVVGLFESGTNKDNTKRIDADKQKTDSKNEGTGSEKQSPLYHLERQESEFVWRTCLWAEFQCKTNYEKQKCQLCSAAFMSDGRIVAMDKANKCLILFSKENKIQSVCLLEDRFNPTSIAVRPDGSIYVLSGKDLATFSIIDTQSGTYITETDCRRLPCEGREISLNGSKICILIKHKVVLFDRRFQRSKLMDISNHIRGHSLVPCFLENKMCNKFLFADWNVKKLFCISWKKELLWEKKFSSPVRSIVDIDDKFMILLSNGDIFLLNGVGKVIGTLKESSLDSAGWLSFHFSTSRLMVAADDGKMQVYKLDRDTCSHRN